MKPEKRNSEKTVEGGRQERPRDRIRRKGNGDEDSLL